MNQFLNAPAGAPLLSSEFALFIEITVAASAILILAGISIFALRRQSAAVRHRVWYCATFGCLLLPFFMAAFPDLGPRWTNEQASGQVTVKRLSLPEADQSSQLRATELSKSITPAEAVVESQAAAKASPRQFTTSSSSEAVPTASGSTGVLLERVPLEAIPEDVLTSAEPESVAAHSLCQIIVTVWLAGIGFSIILLVRHHLVARRLIKQSIDVTDCDAASLMAQLCASLGGKRDVQLRCSAQISVPMVVGLIRPTIVLPAGFGQWSQDRCRVVLAHELTHVQRRDVLAQSIAGLAGCVYWYHPLVWFANRRMRIEREFACDDEVLAMGESPDDYAGHVVDVAADVLQQANVQPRSAKNTPSCAVGMVGRSDLEARIRAIVNPNQVRSRVSPHANRLLLGGVLAVAVTMSLLSPSKSQEVAPDTRPNSSAKELLEATSGNLDSTSTDATNSTAEDEGERKPAESTTVRGLVVDGQGHPAVDATVSIRTARFNTTGRSDHDGTFSIDVPVENLAGSLVIASQGENLSGALQIRHDAVSPSTLRVELKAPRTIDVKVVNRQGDPVSDASVIVQSLYASVATGATDKTGQLSLAVPQDLQLQFVMVDAGARGLDYIAFRRQGAYRSDPFALPHDHSGPITLTLGPTRTVAVKAVDHNSDPIADASVHAWHFRLPKRGGMVNLGSLMLRRTDEQGIASYDNIPLENERDITMWVHKEGYKSEGRCRLDPQADDREIIARLLPLVPLKGRVIHQDGRPVAEITVMISGDGHGMDWNFRSEVTTKDDGTFELDVAPHMYYAIAARSRQWASPLHTRIVRDKPVSGIELTVAKTSRVFGRLTVGDTDESVPDGYVQLNQRPADGGYYDLPSDRRLPNPKDDRSAISAMIIDSVKTGDNGSFEFFVGPGTFDAFGSRDTKQDVFHLTEQREFEIHLKAKPLLVGKLTGRVVLKDNPNDGVAGVNVFGKYMPPMAMTDENGNFESAMLDEDALCGAFTEDLKLGTIKKLAAGTRQVQFELEPTAVLRGTLIHEESGKPAANEEIGASIRITHEHWRRTTYTSRYKRSDTTASDGSFAISGIVPGHHYTLQVVLDRSNDGLPRSWRQVGTFNSPKAGVNDMGQLQLPAPNRPLTLRDHIARAFREQNDLATHVLRRLADAEFTSQQVLLVVADQEADSCKRFFEARYDYAAPNLSLRQALSNYVIVGVDTEQIDFLKKHSITRPADGGLLLWILNSRGDKVAEVQFDALSDDGKLNRDSLAEFLLANARTLPDARQELATAQRTATRDGKRVLVQVSGPGCAPCILLSRYLQAQKALIEKDYVYVKLDSRMPHGEEVISELRPGDDQGIPWMVILSTEGTKLVTSDSEEGNIGFPSTDWGSAHFESMLRRTAQRLSDDDIRLLLNGLSAAN